MRHISTLLGLSALLSACGGGGGDAGAGLNGPLQLNASNYAVAAQEALSSASYVSSTGGLVVATDAQPSAQGAWFAQVLGQLRRAPGRLSDIPVLVTGATQTYTQRCAQGGTLSFEANDANGNHTVDAGDTVSMTATACTVDGETTNGRMTMTFTVVNGDLANSDVFDLSVTVGLTDFSTKDSSGTVVGNGSMGVSINSAGANSLTTSVVANNLTLRATYGGSQYTRSMSAFTVREVFTPAGTGYRSALSIDGSLASSALGSSSITVSTVSPFVRASSQSYPASGQALVTGANGSKVRISLVGVGSVLIELDADGNGSYESSTTRQWRDLV